MKIIVIGDIHGNPIWKEIVKKHAFENVIIVFVGDYFDSKNEYYTTAMQIRNFEDIIAFKKANMDRVYVLIGNHDYQYFPEIPNKGLMSGYQGDGKAVNITYILQENRKYMEIAYAKNNILFSHAGFSFNWAEKINQYLPLDLPQDNAYAIAAYMNILWQSKPLVYDYIPGGDPYGNNTYQSPIWIRPPALMRAGKHLKEKIIQVCGHTAQIQIDIEGKSTGKKYWFIDTLNSNNEYLIIDGNNFISGKI